MIRCSLRLLLLYQSLLQNAITHRSRPDLRHTGSVSNADNLRGLVLLPVRNLPRVADCVGIGDIIGHDIEC